MFMQQSSYTIVHVKGEDNVVADSLCHDYLHDDESEQALAHEAESVELIATFLATQDMVEYAAPTPELIGGGSRHGGRRCSRATVTHSSRST
jgi:hypothetical protein